jgi:TonB family protein
MSKKSAQELFAEVEEGEKIVVECERKVREYQIARFGRVLPKVLVDGFGDRPTNIVKPYYPREAKQFGISGIVKVETIVDENGQVIYARIVKGRPFLGRVVIQAAYHSSYTPRKICDGKPVKFRWTIIYRFILNR